MTVKVLSVFGTRPEAIKMAPVVMALNACKHITHTLVVTAQHRQILDQVLDLFNLQPDYDLAIMRPEQSLTDITKSILTSLDNVLEIEKPDLILVHGDTSTTLASSLAAFYKQIPVAHVEAGLRSGDIYSPWPEEINRKLTTNLSTLHFAPTQQAKDNLLKENINETSIFITGNTVIDSLLYCLSFMKNQTEEYDKLYSDLDIDPDLRIILVTGHRRENFGDGFIRICDAIKILSKRDDIQIIYSVHPNPNVHNIVHERLSGIKNIKLIPPQEYIPFLYLLEKSYLVLTDSGGIQEEAPSLGKPVLVMRNKTERIEAITAGTVKLVGTNTVEIVSSVEKLLDLEEQYKLMSNARNPYGDGRASERIIGIILKHFGIY